jgi:hypothetical protein
MLVRLLEAAAHSRALGAAEDRSQVHDSGQENEGCWGGPYPSSSEGSGVNLHSLSQGLLGFTFLQLANKFQIGKPMVL